jgi:hypothetical protein
VQQTLIAAESDQAADARDPPPLQETIPEEVLTGTIPTTAPDPELAGMPPLIPMVPRDDDAASSVASTLPVLGAANWENFNADEDNKEDKHENDVVEEAGEDACILENFNDHVIKREGCEAEKKKLIDDGLTCWTALGRSL